MNFNRVPVRQWIHREFEGIDPWAANQSTRWSIVTYRLVPESMARITVCDSQSVASESNDIPKVYKIGICETRYGRYRILPKALAKAWRRCEVRDLDLPGLLYQGEEPLRLKNDPSGPVSSGERLHAFLLALLALIMFTFYLFQLPRSN